MIRTEMNYSLTKSNIRNYSWKNKLLHTEYEIQNFDKNCIIVGEMYFNIQIDTNICTWTAHVYKKNYTFILFWARMVIRLFMYTIPIVDKSFGNVKGTTCFSIWKKQMRLCSQFSFWILAAYFTIFHQIETNFKSCKWIEYYFNGMFEWKHMNSLMRTLKFTFTFT